MDGEQLAQLSATMLDSSTKGLALRARETVRADQVVQRGWSVPAGDTDLPLLVLKERELGHNIELMADYCRRHGVSLAPHGKTTMAPQLFHRQLAAGAWGITAATVSHCRTYRQYGVERILLANVLVDASGIRWVADEMEAGECQILCYVDSVAGVDAIEVALSSRPVSRRLQVLVELGFPHGRTGCRSHEEALALAQRVRASEVVELRGVAGFEGLMPGNDPEESLRQGDELLCRIHDLATALHAGGHVDRGRDVIVSAGGSAYFDRVVAMLGPEAFMFPVHTILRSGCYVTHDAEMYGPTSPLDGRAPTGSPRLRPALELWATVWSRPEPELAILGFGKRDCPYDYRLPVPQTVWHGTTGKHRRDVEGLFQITALNDQHAFMRVPANDPLEVGERVTSSISHPCGAFDKWRFIPVVDGERTIVGGIFTLF